jgi:hypothetical protein
VQGIQKLTRVSAKIHRVLSEIKAYSAAEIVNLEKPSLEGADHAGYSKRDEQLFHWIKVNHTI